LLQKAMGRLLTSSLLQPVGTVDWWEVKNTSSEMLRQPEIDMDDVTNDPSAKAIGDEIGTDITSS
jgi:hypothetical protein